MYEEKDENRVELRGTVEGEMKTFTGAKSTKLSFRLVTVRNYNGQEFKETHNIAVWGERAERAAARLREGDRLTVCGRIGTRKYQKQDGTDAYFTEITAYSLLDDITAAPREEKADYAQFGQEQIPF